MKLLSLIAVLAALGAPAAVPAAEDADLHTGHRSADSQALPWVNAEVRKIDKSNRKVSLRHEAIPNLGMEGMTMVFTVSTPQMLDGLKVGDKVRFSAERKEGRIVVTRLEPVK